MRSKIPLTGLLCLGLVFVSLAGCLSTDSTPVENKVTPPADDAKTEKPKPVKLYSFEGLVAGASPTDPSGPGRLSAATPIAKTETFQVKGNFSRLDVQADFVGGGNGRFEVYDGNGTRVFATVTKYSAGAPGGPAASLDVGSVVEETDHPANGTTYTVQYFVAGAFNFKVTVNGVPPKPPAADKS